MEFTVQGENRRKIGTQKDGESKQKKLDQDPLQQHPLGIRVHCDEVLLLAHLPIFSFRLLLPQEKLDQS